ncbi:hypothetical protein Golob_002054 [Gossypium lobatum]|uniref:Uncharacterized protein n=1 Tax=Gossypium lobatum TaxID=34289 RepID=A0A7J8N3V3_9ROSI|nr:hypothetical protein [Gossypium lobatum]
MEITKSMEPLVQMNQHLRDLKPYFLNFVLALPLLVFMHCKGRMYFLRDLASPSANFT